VILTTSPFKSREAACDEKYNEVYNYCSLGLLEAVINKLDMNLFTPISSLSIN